MKRQRGIIEQAALDAGVAPVGARRVMVMMDAESTGLSGPSAFMTAGEVNRHAQIVQLVRLRWLVDLAQGSTAINQSTMAHEIMTFAQPYRDDSTRGGKVPSAPEAVRFVRDFADGLKELVGRRASGIKWTLKVSQVTRTLTGSGGSRWRAADWRGAFVLHAAELIDRYSDRIRQCGSSDCGRVFVSDDPRRQKFCSLRCGAAERQRQFRAGKADWTGYRREGRERRERQRTQQREAREKIERIEATKKGKEPN